MSPVRKSTRVRAHRPPAVPPLPHLSAFLSGYLHQDFFLDHRTPAGALKTFLADASAAERRALGDEWRAFEASTRELPWREVKRAFAALGGAWIPPTRAALHALFDAIR